MIRAGVIGVGTMGGHHARVYASLSGDCRLVGVYDPDHERAAAVAGRCNTVAYSSVEALLADVDVVSVASPSSLHFEHSALAIESGCDVLVEKPVAMTVDHAAMLERLASLRPERAVVQVGHIEHFNPAVAELRTLLTEHEPIAVDMQRLGPFDGRIEDADVVQDLMLHDIHVLLTIARSPLVDVRAAGRSVLGDGNTDYAVATFTFASGLIATLSASRVTEEKIRRLTVTCTDAHITLDALQRSLQRARMTTLREAAGGAAGYRQESVVERIFVPIEEPLVRQLRSFLGSVAERSDPAVPLRMGRTCLEVVEEVRASIAAASQDDTAVLRA